MSPKSPDRLDHIRESAEFILSATGGKSLQEYSPRPTNRLLSTN
jgi:hypothetical protein